MVITGANSFIGTSVEYKSYSVLTISLNVCYI